MSNTQLLEVFKDLHQQREPLLLGNVWDAYTAKIAEEVGYKALGTSSHAIAFMLGYEDGEKLSFEELLAVVERIVATVNIPVSVDFESGYADDPEQVAHYVKQLVDIGVVGINLEDGKVVDGKRSLGDQDLLVHKIKAIKAVSSLYINARADTYTTKHPQALQESIKRGQAYQAAGADGLFIPLLEKEDEIRSFIQEVSAPLNLFTTAHLPDYKTLADLGVKRISHGAKQYELLMKKSRELFVSYLESQDYRVMLGT